MFLTKVNSYIADIEKLGNIRNLLEVSRGEFENIGNGFDRARVLHEVFVKPQGKENARLQDEHSCSR